MAARSAKMRPRLAVHPVLDPPATRPPHMGEDEWTLHVARMMARHSPKDVLDMGLMVEQWLETPVAELICRTLHHLKAIAVHDSRQPTIPAERLLGQLQAYDTVLNTIESYVLDRRQLQQHLVEESHSVEEEEGR